MLAGGGIPDAGGLVSTAGENFCLILAPNCLIDSAGVTFQQDELLAGGGIPDADCVVSTAGENFGLIPAPDRLIDRPGVAVEQAACLLPVGQRCV